MAKASSDCTHFVELHSHIIGPCEICKTGMTKGLSVIDDETLAVRINHYITEHGYHVYHVGQATTHGPDGPPWQNTVAILGK